MSHRRKLHLTTSILIFISALVSACVSVEPEKAWGLKFPHGGHIGETHGDIEIGRNGEFYVGVIGGEKPGLQVYSPAGLYHRNVPNLARGYHDFLLLDGENGDQMIIGVLPTEVVKTDLEGNILQSIDVESVAISPRVKPLRLSGVAIDGDGNIFVVDGYGDDHIYKFSASGNLISIFGGREPPHSLQNAHNILIDNRGSEERLLITDRENYRIVSTNLDGNDLRLFSQDLRLPSAMVLCNGEIIVGELEGRVVALNGRGEVSSVLSVSPDYGELQRDERPSKKTPPEAWRDGIVTRPHGLACAADGAIYVSDWNLWGRVLKLDRQ